MSIYNGFHSMTTGFLGRADSLTHLFCRWCAYLEIQRGYEYAICTFGYPFGQFASFHHQCTGCTRRLEHSETRVLYNDFFTYSSIKTTPTAIKHAQNIQIFTKKLQIYIQERERERERERENGCLD